MVCWVIFCLFFSRNFTSAQTIRVEAGLASVMEQYDKNFKLRRVMGSPSIKKVDGTRPAEEGKDVKKNHSSKKR
jgi:hypothetical protein